LFSVMVPQPAIRWPLSARRSPLSAIYCPLAATAHDVMEITRTAGSGWRSATAKDRCAVVVIFAVPPVSSPGPTRTPDHRTAVAVIPARYHSSRLPGKALADIDGRPMIEHVYRRTCEARSIASVIVATDDRRIADAVAAFGGDVRMTSPTHQSGTDRLAEVAATLACDLIVNVQGDEPLIEPAMIDEAVAPFATQPDLQMSTLRRQIDDVADFTNPNVTKVVVDLDGYALYFSRSPIPYVRADATAAQPWRHVGLYVYRRDCLLTLANLPPTALEKSEALEQLRALEHGIRIKAVATQYDSIGVDTPEDLERARRIFGDRRVGRLASIQ
jgi:3-deoxy-manno-octulosonate cytidylyltransferase (CMP-KDO synthetase)